MSFVFFERIRAGSFQREWKGTEPTGGRENKLRRR